MDEISYYGRRDADTLVDAIYTAYADEDGEARHSWSLKPSEIGKECGRAVQLSWMWASPPKKFDGRMKGLFKDGERIETELIQDLKRVGWEVIEKDPERPTKQIKVEALDGHSKGFLDGQGRDRVAVSQWMVIECKSHNDASFKKTKKHGVAASKPEHYAQMQIYMHERGVTLALYIYKNKNTSEKATEYVTYDAKYVERLYEKGRMIMGKSTLLPRISKKPDYYKCIGCDQHAVCHEGKSYERNCRTCQHSRPIADGKWGCDKYQCEIGKELMLASCADYELAMMLRPQDGDSASSRHSPSPAQAGPASEAPAA